MAATNNNSGASPRSRRRKKPLALRIIGGFLGGIFKTLGTLILIGICTCAILACFAVVYVQNSIIPQAKEVVEALEIFDITQSSVMYYKDAETGQLVEMLTLSGAEERDWVKYNEIPKNLINATIAIEDKRFYSHQGVDWKRTAAGLVYMFTGQDIQGGSTITQQLIKNMTQYDDVTVKRKILEIFTALEFEKTHSKEEILEWYLNYIYLGERCYGVSAASLNYFGKELQDLTLEECASLISITNNPSIYNPYRYPENNLRRRNLCLDEMAKEENGPMISQAECDAAKATPLNLKRETGTKREQEIYTWYEDQVIDEVIEDLMSEYGITKEYASNLLYYGGLRIETCYDPTVQAYVDAVYKDRSVLELDSKTGQQIQSGITIVDNRTGHVVAIAGGIGEKEENRGWSRAYDSKRPPGSSIKPLAVYAPALDLGFLTPATVIDDVPVLLLDEEGIEVPASDALLSDPEMEISAWPKNSYNYFKGLTTVFEAVEDSVNTIAVRVLRDLVTPEVSYQYLEERFGISSLEEGRWVNDFYKTDITLASLALGGLTDGVSTYDMAAAYSVFANNGMYTEPTTYTRVVAVDIDGNETVLLEHNSIDVAVLKESTVYYMNTMLENVIDAGTGTAAKFEGMTIAGKTGTTTSNNDKWFVGYSPYYSAAVWVGYDKQERIASSKYLAAELWKLVMEPLHAGLADIGFQEPIDVTTVTICKDSGMIASEACYADPRGERTMKMTFVKGDQPLEYCTTHVAVEVCTESTVIPRYDGKDSGVYHLATDYCPETSVKVIGLLDHERIRVLDTVTTRDDVYLKSYLETLGITDDPLTTVVDAGLCDVHKTAPYDPSLFDPDDYTTWPFNNPDYPNFSILDETTWPNYRPPFDPSNPATWPTDDPFFDIEDVTTWPKDETSSGNDTSQDSDDDGGFSFSDWISNWFG